MRQSAIAKPRSPAKRVARVRRGAGSKTLTEKAYQELEERIVTLQLKPGEFISEYALSHDLKIGRTPIREALQRLNREDLVTILPRKGILVSETDPRKQLLVLEVRRELERLVSRLAAQRASEGQRQQFSAIAAEMDRAAKSNDDIMFMRLDRELNRLITTAAQNDYAARAMRFFAGTLSAILVPALQASRRSAAMCAAARQSSACSRGRRRQSRRRGVRSLD